MDYQPFPQTGQLAKNTNLEISDLERLISGNQAKVYFYVVATVENRGGKFFQTGCGPNFQGDLITLCTCKHWMRSFMAPEAWEGKWVAGVSSSSAGNGRNALVYLMKVGKAFVSQKALWETEYLPDATKHAKAAHLDRFGDIFKPQNECSDPYDARSYMIPHHNHCHISDNQWQKDIHYPKGCSDRQPALLAGEPEYSLLWNKPVIYFSEKVHRGQRKSQLGEFFSQLKEY